MNQMAIVILLLGVVLLLLLLSLHPKSHSARTEKILS
jgi:hypothetical protein